MAMILADGGPKGMADPAFPAHIATMGHWSMAIWERWLPRRHLQLAIADAKVRLLKAARPWQQVFGPAAAFIASAARLNWRVQDAENCTTDLGRQLNLATDPPAVVKHEISESVRRWRWRNVGAQHGSSGIGKKGAYADPPAHMETSEHEAAVHVVGVRPACWA